jgi:hypothetical protein
MYLRGLFPGIPSKGLSRSGDSCRPKTRILGLLRDWYSQGSLHDGLWPGACKSSHRSCGLFGSLSKRRGHPSSVRSLFRRLDSRLGLQIFGREMQLSPPRNLILKAQDIFGQRACSETLMSRICSCNRWYVLALAAPGDRLVFNQCFLLRPYQSPRARSLWQPRRAVRSGFVDVQLHCTLAYAS